MEFTEVGVFRKRSIVRKIGFLSKILDDYSSRASRACVSRLGFLAQRDLIYERGDSLETKILSQIFNIAPFILQIEPGHLIGDDIDG